MIRKRPLFGSAVFLLTISAGAAIGQLPGYPAPRYPKVPDITSVEQLLPYARFIVAKPGDKTIVIRPGYGIQGSDHGGTALCA
ncbi:MAG: hypothetical protein HYX73_05605 [Acidobacteria bacterium]|nr:hypothetical protein [Acidobacteriota bacterium]